MSDRALHLIARHLEGSLTTTELAEFNTTLRTNPAARTALIQATLHARLLNTRLNTDNESSEPTPTSKPDVSPPRANVRISDNPISAAGVPMYRKGYEPQPFKLRAHHFALAAAALLAACGLAAYVFIFAADPQSPDDPPQSSSPTPVATLIQNTGNLRTPHGYPAEGDDYGRGEYALDHGTAEFMLTNAVNVKLRGQTRLRMHSNANVALTQGNATFLVPRDARGFTVHLPDNIRIVDLGTRFSAIANPDGSSQTRVLEGRVAWTHDTTSITLDAGHIVQVRGESVVHKVAVGPLEKLTLFGPLRDGGFDSVARVSNDTSVFVAAHDASDAWVGADEKMRVRLYPSTPQVPAHSPPHFAQFTGHQAGGSAILQTVQTRPGIDYELAFHMARVGEGSVPSFEIDIHNGVATKLGPGDLHHERFDMDWPHLKWREMRIRFTALSDTTTIRFTEPVDSRTLNTAPVIDSVTLTPLPDAAVSPKPNSSFPIGDPE